MGFNASEIMFSKVKVGNFGPKLQATAMMSLGKTMNSLKKAGIVSNFSFLRDKYKKVFLAFNLPDTPAAIKADIYASDKKIPYQAAVYEQYIDLLKELKNGLKPIQGILLEDISRINTRSSFPLEQTSTYHKLININGTLYNYEYVFSIELSQKSPKTNEIVYTSLDGCKKLFQG